MLRPGERVQRAPLVPGGPQPHLVGLAVHGHQRVGELGEHRHGDAVAAEEGARPAGGGHGAQRHEAAVVVQLRARVPRALGDRGAGLEHETALGHRTLGPDAHHGGVGASAQDQREPAEHHGLARAGLAGDRGQPGRERYLGPLDHAEVPDPQLLDHPSATGSSAQPFQPATGRENRDTRRSVNGAGLRRASRTGSGPRRTSTRLPTGRSVRRWPSQHSSPELVDRRTISTASTERGPTTSGRANSACAETGTMTIASRSGHTTGPPAENACAVDPVEVAITMPSQPNDDSGRPSTSTRDGDHPGSVRLLHGGLVERPVGHGRRTGAVHGDLDGAALLDRVVALGDPPHDGVDLLALGLGEEADVAEVHPDQRCAGAAGELGGPQDRAVAAEHQHGLQLDAVLEVVLRDGAHADLGERPRREPRRCRGIGVAQVRDDQDRAGHASLLGRLR